MMCRRSMLVGISLVIGCAQSQITSQPPPISAAGNPSPADQAAEIEQARHDDSDTTGLERIRVRIQQVEFMESAIVDAALLKVWDGMTPAVLATNDEPAVARTRVVSTEDISAALDSLTSQGQIRIQAEPPTLISSGRTRTWNGFVKWSMTPSAQSPNSIHLKLSGNVVKTISVAETKCQWKVADEGDLHAGETMIVEGPESRGMSTEITRIPVFGDIPFVGPLLFSGKKTRVECHKSLFLVTASMVAEADAVK